MKKTFFATLTLALSLFTISCSKSSGGEEPDTPTDNSTSFSLKVGTTTYNLDSINVIETSQGYYIRATQKGNTNDANGVSVFINTKTSNNSTSFGDVAEAGKVFISASFTGSQNVSSHYTNPTSGNVSNSTGSANVSINNNTITTSVNAQLFNTKTGVQVPVELSFKTPKTTQTNNNPYNEFFDFELSGATYNLRALSAAPYDKGFVIQGLASNNQIVALVINTKTSNNTIPFGDEDDAGKASSVFNIPSVDHVYTTTAPNCQGVEVHNQGTAKLTSIGNVGGYIEGYISGSAYKDEDACDGSSESFSGYFKIRRLN